MGMKTVPVVATTIRSYTFLPHGSDPLGGYGASAPHPRRALHVSEVEYRRLNCKSHSGVGMPASVLARI